jgi:A nuclease family of the HNH/ENDO VII superfamily with conserved AHH
MPNTLDGMTILAPASRNKCPICEKAPHDTTKDKKEDLGELKSIPANLGCTPLVPLPSLVAAKLNYTTAAHHLIPARQCLAKFPRLSQMCKAVGYNVNNPQNGMSLPTVGQKEKNVYGGRKYGRLPPSDKMAVAYVIMDATDMQWHVGHHNWVLLNLDTDDIKHPPNYDKLVKLKLRNIEKNIKKQGKAICDPDKKEPGKEVITKLNKESQTIKGRIASWKRYYVSALSYEFGKQYR